MESAPTVPRSRAVSSTLELGTRTLFLASTASLSCLRLQDQKKERVLDVGYPLCITRCFSSVLSDACDIICGLVVHLNPHAEFARWVQPSRTCSGQEFTGSREMLAVLHTTYLFGLLHTTTSTRSVSWYTSCDHVQKIEGDTEITKHIPEITSSQKFVRGRSGSIRYISSSLPRSRYSL